MPPRTNCPNCAAPITGPICEYCGTHFKPKYNTAILYADAQPVAIEVTPISCKCFVSKISDTAAAATAWKESAIRG